MKIDQLLNMPLLAEMIKGGVVSKKDNGDHSILNYTQRAQWENVWNEVTTQCRGIVYNRVTGEVLARPFPKFFNYGQMTADIPTGPIRVTDKLDGSLGIAYWDGEEMRVATRGAFGSDQARWATVWLWQHCKGRFDISKTYLFEIIYPGNRIVVNYGDRAELVLLEVIDIETGVPDVDLFSQWPGPKADVLPFSSMADLLAAPARSNAEGFVVYFSTANTRLKVKHDEYVRLHKLVTGLSVKSIWEALSGGQTIESLCSDVPDEFFEWVKIEAKALLDQHASVKRDAEYAYLRLRDEVPAGDRKAFALKAAKMPASNLLFGLLDNRPIDLPVWKMIKPVGSRTFKVDVDA